MSHHVHYQKGLAVTITTEHKEAGEKSEEATILVLNDPLHTLPELPVSSRYSRSHHHPHVPLLRPANDDEPDPDWIEATVTSRSNGQFVTYHQRKPTYSALSAKTRRLVSCESHWERLHQMFLDHDPECIDYELQGLEIRYVDVKGRNHLFTLDAVAARTDGLHAYEVKATRSYFLVSPYNQVMANVEDILSRIDITLHKVTGISIAQDLRLMRNLSFGWMHSFDKVEPEQIEAVRSALATGSAPFGDVRHLLDDDQRVQVAKAHALMTRRVLAFDLHSRLTNDSVISLPRTTRQRDIRRISARILR